MIYDNEEMKPKIFGTASFVIAIAFHLLIVVILWCTGFFKPPKEKEIVIPIDLTVVVHDNLDGAEDEPPPVLPPEPVPEPQPPEVTPPPPEPEPPAPEPPEVKPTEAVVIEKKDPPKEEKKPEKEKPVKKPPPKDPQPPKITREERMARMRASTKPVKSPPKQNNGKTDMRPKDWEKLLNEGYRPSSINQGLNASEAARCYALIRKAFYEKWDSPAWTSELKKASLEVSFGRNGEVLGYKLVGSFGDAVADKTVLRAASCVSRVRGLSPDFLSNNRTVIVRFEVTPE